MLETDQDIQCENVRHDGFDASAQVAQDYHLPRPGGEEVRWLTARVGTCHWSAASARDAMSLGVRDTYRLGSRAQAWLPWEGIPYGVLLCGFGPQLCGDLAKELDAFLLSSLLVATQQLVERWPVE